METEKNTKKNIRQPIVTVCGHVDHGKTSVLDSLRNTTIQKGEAGNITQKISFTKYPLEKLKQSCPLIEKSGIQLNIPGFLFIDTPGHAAFTNLRKRGGGLADLAILVIDINDGIKPQTAEVIQLLKKNSTPFIIALNKIDNISAWQSQKPGEISLKENIEKQPQRVQQVFNERYLTLIGSLNSYGFEADLFYNINDFTKKIALVPCSAETQEGIPELIMMLCGLSQKYLQDKLTLNNEPRGVVLEVKKNASGNFIEAILHDGKLNKNDEIAIANINFEAKGNEPIISKIRVLEEIKPLSEKFEPVENAQASTGIRIQIKEKSEILPGMPFLKFQNNKKEIKEIFEKELSETLLKRLSKQGIIAKADSLGSLEALLTMLKQNNIQVVKAGIGNINKRDIISAKANLDINELDAVIVGFNTSLDEDAKELSKSYKGIKVFTEEVVYKLIEELLEFREQKRKEIEKKRLMELATISKIKILPEYVFRNSNPAVFGVKVLGGKIVQNQELIDSERKKIGRIKNIQSENKPVESAEKDMEVAISIPGVNFERQLKDTENLYSNLSEKQFKTFKKNKDLLGNEEIKVLQEIADIKRREKIDWGK
ncbi:MAG: translation initiation factor IF-2 [Nanoarchaeota archaeon]